MITGGAPQSGYRIALDRGPSTTPPFVYRGVLTFPEASYDVVAEVGLDHSVSVVLGIPDGALRAALAEKVRLLVRQVVRQAASEATEPSARAPARKIVRWRGEK